MLQDISLKPQENSTMIGLNCKPVPNTGTTLNQRTVPVPDIPISD